MKLDQYIKELLIEKDSIIIKDFGAFEKVLQSAEIDEETGEIKPPHVTLKFDPSLKIDSGTLSKFIAEKEKISEEEAVKQIAEQVKNWEEDLKAGKSVLLEGIGIVKQSAEGTKTFEPKIEQGTFPDMYGLPVITVEKAEPINPRKQPIRREPPKKKEQVKQEKKIPEKKVPQKKKPVRKTRPVKKTMTKEESEKAFKKFIMVLLIVVPIIIIGVLVALNFDTVKEKLGAGTEYVSNLFSGEDNTDTTDQVVQDIQEADSNQIAEIDNIDSVSSTQDDTKKILEDFTVIDGQTNQTITPDEQVGSGYKVEIIAGSFKKLQNAKRYRNQLNNKGFSAKVLPKSNGLYRVSVGSFNDLNEAGAEIVNLHEIDPTLNVWILLNK